MEAGELLGKREKNRPKLVKIAETRAAGGAEIWHPSASVSFRGRPWTSAACVAGRWKLGNYEERQRKTGLNGRNQGGVGEILLPPAAADVRGHPRHVWPEDGRCEIMRKNRETLA